MDKKLKEFSTSKSVKESKKSDKTKLVLYRDELEASEDAFATPLKKRRKVVGAEPNRKNGKCLKKDYPSLYINPPFNLISVMKKFTVEQQNTVKKMGFDGILGATVRNLPLKLGFWLAKNYDPDSNTLQIGNKSLLITRQTVKDVYGFPMGNTPINASERTSPDDVVVQEFQNQFSTKGSQIRMSDVLRELVKDVTSGRKFILNFLVSMVTVYLGGTTFGGVNRKFLPNIQADTDIMDLDWCTYALECLNRARRSWNFTKKNTYFTGPLLLLVVLYVSSTISPGERIERRFPLMNCWTTETLNKREANEMTKGFGKLKIADGFVLVDNNESEEMTESRNGAKRPREEAHNKPSELVIVLPVKQGETLREPLPQLPVADQHIDMSNLQHITKKQQSSQSRKQLNKLVTMITNLQKQMEGQASEAKRHEEERENWLINLKKQIELQAFEAESREEREKSLVTNLHKQMELQASESKRREQEIEKQAEERVKYIVSNIQKQMECQEEERDTRAQKRDEWMVSNMQKHMDRWVEGRDKRAEEREKSLLTNLQKHMEVQASEAKCREQEREKSLVTSIKNQIEFHASVAKRLNDESQKSLLTNLKKHMEVQASEAKCHEEEREKLLATNLQKQLELQGLEAKRQEQEREKLADEREKYIVNNIQKKMELQEEAREKQAQEREERTVSRIQKLMERQAVEAERREKEKERRDEIRAHAIIWDIERQRHFHEQEQDQLRIAWNKFNNANGLNEFQFPHMSHTSFHPPGVESKYYDSAQGNEIPKEFQSLYCDIYGPRR